MKDLQTVANHLGQQQNNPVVDSHAQDLINKTIKSLYAIFPSAARTIDNHQANNFKASLTKAIIENNISTIEQLERGLKYFRKNGGEFFPSVPKFIQACLGKLDESGFGRKPPEHRWFDKSKLLSKVTEAERIAARDKHLTNIRDMLKRTK